MSDASDTDTETESGQDQPEQTVEESRRTKHSIWVSGTEERMPFADATNEGAQELLPRDEDPALDVQRGVAVDDDFVDSDDICAGDRESRCHGLKYGYGHAFAPR